MQTFFFFFFRVLGLYQFFRACFPQNTNKKTCFEMRIKCHHWITYEVHGAWVPEDIVQIELWNGDLLKGECIVGCKVQVLYELTLTHEFAITKNQRIYKFRIDKNVTTYFMCVFSDQNVPRL